ncbi:hypothetical protein K445DRAFT_24718 [Daldinia sp. EC12]|nr:hypothetical protein K445DRAFT_24718 [Daldinia sp. EC12]
MDGMLLLRDLAGSQFVLDGKTEWGLMIGKWMERRGRIDLEKIAAYIDKETALMGTVDETSDVKLQHFLFFPVLKGYITTEDKACGLLHVLYHEYSDRSSAFFEDEDPPWAGVPPEDLDADVDESLGLAEPGIDGPTHSNAGGAGLPPSTTKST